ncbi:MAG TPA: shikimate dehydrogenase [Solirubrobacteraceae bacterium]|nr:shikimate dehydrogenase [Solirubrobacteraceae bacterium]
MQEEVAKRLGVLGWPVAHSRSPAMHNAALAALGMQGWRYQLLPVAPVLLAQTVRALGDSGFVGANVTIPHKQAALALADSASDVARAVGAANTLTFAGDGEIAAENTDAPGLIAAIGEPLAGRSALVLGAGGSARAAVWALRDAGAARVSIHNRTHERARQLALELAADVAEQPLAADVLVNCTSVGLDAAEHELAQLALDEGKLGQYALVVDLAYREGDTQLVRAARAGGARTVDGLDVLVAQGALSLELWTGREAPLDVMRAAARAS